MIPLPGFQKPMPYFSDTVRRNSYTSLLVSRANLRSMSAPALAWMRWSQCTVDGTATACQPGGHELQQRHLGGGVLHGDAVGVEVVVAAAALEVLARVAQVVHEDLLGQREAAPEAVAADGHALGEAAVHLLHQLDGGGGGGGGTVGHGRTPCVVVRCIQV